MKYYLYMCGDAVGSLRRTNFGKDAVILERWDGKKWVDSPETMAVTGYASDADNYKEITKAEADKFIKKSKKA